MQFESARKSFLDHLQIERGLSANSISAYSRDLMKFADFLVARGLDFEKIDSEVATEFEVSLKEGGLALASINRSVSALKTFYKYLSREYSIFDPTTEMSANRLPRKLPKALTIIEITSLLNSTERIGDLTALRDRAILEVLYGT
jgi:integrase/recombinase XerD